MAKSTEDTQFITKAKFDEIPKSQRPLQRLGRFMTTERRAMSVPELGTTSTQTIEYDPTCRFQKSNTILEENQMQLVYSAFDTETAIEVAWVEYWGIPTSIFNALESSIEELKHLNHPNIVNYHQAWVDRRQKKVIFVTEAMPTIGRGCITTVHRYFITRKVKMKISVLKNWLYQVLSGLQFLHSLSPPVMHRDLRCANIFMRTNIGRLKIGALELGIFMKYCRPAEFGGKPGYMPVDLAWENFNEKSDIYSFGMCALEMFTFKYPYYECNTSYEIFSKQLVGEMPLGLTLVDDPVARDLIEKCLAPAELRPTAQDLLQHTFFLPHYGADALLSDSSLQKVQDIAEDLPGEPSSVAIPIDENPPITSIAPLSVIVLNTENEEKISSVVTEQQVTQQELIISSPTPTQLNSKNIKCYTSTAECLRIYFDTFSSVEQLKKIIASDLTVSENNIQLEYLDFDGDYVLVTKRTAVGELLEFAKSLKCIVAN